MGKLLIVEDNESLGSLYQLTFQNEGHTVFVAKTGGEAVDILRSIDPDVVVLDIKLPDMNCVEVLHQILSQKNTIPVIINSAYSQYMDDFRFWAAKEFVVKSTDVSELKSKVKKYMN